MKRPWYLKTIEKPYQNEEGDWIIYFTPRRIYLWWLKAQIKRGKELHINITTLKK
jgi:hypothetical protein